MSKKKTQQNIPKGWQLVTLGDIADFKKGKGLPKDDLVADGKCEAIHYGELFTKYSEEIVKVLSRTNNSSSAFLSKANDILMPTSDVTPRGLSTASWINKDGVILGGDILVIRPKNKNLNGLFFSYLVTASKKEVIKLVSGTTVFHLYGSDLARFKFGLPPATEQQRIVTVLKTWDRAIEKLKRKIEIKKEVKKGLMQNIMSGKVRIEGFSDKWRVLPLSNLCHITTGKKDVNEGNPKGAYPFFTCAREHTYSDVYSFDTEAILIAGNADVGHCKYYKGKFEAYQRTYVLSDFKNIDAKYLFLFLSHYFKNHVESLKQIGAMSYIKLPMLRDFLVRLPDKDEQIAIANLLTTASAEVEKLEEKLLKLEDQKRYLLNNLITGTIRTPETLSTSK